MAYGKELKIRAVEFFLKGNTVLKTSEIFSVGYGTVSRWASEYKAGSDLSSKKRDRTSLRKITPEKIEALLAANPQANQNDMAIAFSCTQQSVFAALKKFGFSKKNSQNYTRKPTL